MKYARDPAEGSALLEGEVWAEEVSCATTLRDTSLWSQAGLREARDLAAARRAVVFRGTGTFLEHSI